MAKSGSPNEGRRKQILVTFDISNPLERVVTILIKFDQRIYTGII